MKRPIVKTEWILGLWLCISAHAAAVADELQEAARAGEFSASGLYEPVVTEFGNGLILIANQRTGVRTVSVRIHIALGSSHYECGDQQIPHYLEHMLYDSIPGMSEGDFNARMSEYGASTNARTGTTSTIFELDVFSGTVLKALDLTADMILETELREASFDKARRIIYQEMGGEPSPVQKETYVGGRLASATDEALADIGSRYFGLCGAWDAGLGLSYESIVEAYEQHYVPSRMVWIIVGDFDSDRLEEWAEERLASAPRTESPPARSPTVARFERDVYRGYQNEPGVVLAGLTDGLLGEDFYARTVLIGLLSDRLYERLRLQEGLGYYPYASESVESTFGILFIGTDAEERHHEKVMKLLREVIAEVRAEPLPLAGSSLKWEKIAVLRSWAQAIETNAEYAEYYAARLSQFWRDGHFLNEEVAVAELTVEDIRRVARQVLAEERLVEIYEADVQAVIQSVE